jgi:hypothetical protein
VVPWVWVSSRSTLRPRIERWRREEWGGEGGRRRAQTRWRLESKSASLSRNRVAGGLPLTRARTRAPQSHRTGHRSHIDDTRFNTLRGRDKDNTKSTPPPLLSLRACLARPLSPPTPAPQSPSASIAASLSRWRTCTRSPRARWPPPLRVC